MGLPALGLGQPGRILTASAIYTPFDGSSITILNWQSLPLNVARVMVARVSLGVDATLPNPPYNNANSMLVEVWFTRTINRPPTVSAGSNQTVQFGHTVTLRGTVFDPDGDSTTVLWTLIGGTGSNGIQINGANSPTATFTAPSEPRVLTFQFCANDGEALPVCATTQVTVVAHTADLSITIGDSPDPVIVGDTLTYTLTAINNGPGDATGVTLTDRLPTGVTFVSASASAAQSVKAVHTDFRFFR